MIARVTPHLAPSLPRHTSPEPVVCELLDDAHRPSVRPVRVVNDREPASNGRGGQLSIERQSARSIARPMAGAPVRRVTAVNTERVQSMIARSTRAAAAAGIYGSARMFFGALDLYVSPYHRGEAGASTATI